MHKSTMNHAQREMLVVALKYSHAYEELCWLTDEELYQMWMYECGYIDNLGRYTADYLRLRSELNVQDCTREQPHDGPCNGWPCEHAQSVMGSKS